MAAYEGKLYFRAYTTTSGKEVWRHDPTDGSTVQVTEIYPGSTSSSPIFLTVYDGKLYFRALTP